MPFRPLDHFAGNSVSCTVELRHSPWWKKKTFLWPGNSSFRSSHLKINKKVNHNGVYCCMIYKKKRETMKISNERRTVKWVLVLFICTHSDNSEQSHLSPLHRFFLCLGMPSLFVLQNLNRTPPIWGPSLRASANHLFRFISFNWTYFWHWP